MNSLNITLLTEGTSDKALIPHLRWLLQQNGVRKPIDATWAELRHLPKKIDIRGLAKKIDLSLQLYPCDLLFIHRDTDRETITARKEEIFNSIDELDKKARPNCYICVIPVRMTEAWLLFNENAIRRASGNPNGTDELELPRIQDTEGISNPKEVLNNALKTASGRKGRRLSKFNVGHSVTLISEFVDDFSPLRQLNAFQELETDIKDIISKINLAD